MVGQSLFMPFVALNFRFEDLLIQLDFEVEMSSIVGG